MFLHKFEAKCITPHRQHFQAKYSVEYLLGSGSTLLNLYLDF